MTKMTSVLDEIRISPVKAPLFNLTSTNIFCLLLVTKQTENIIIKINSY